MHVVMLTRSYYPRIGGAERQVASLSRWLQDSGVEVQVVTRSYPGYAAFEKIDDVPVHRVNVPGPKAMASLAFTLTALALLRRLRPDVLHAHELFSPATTAVAAKRLWATPVVATAHSSGDGGDVRSLLQEPLGKQRMDAYRAHVDAFTAINRLIMTELAEAGIDGRRCFFLPNGVDVDYYAPLSRQQKKALRAGLGLEDVPTAVFVGRLVHLKRVDRLIDCWPAVRKAVPSAELLILGDGPEEETWRQLAGPGIRFLGRHDDVLPYLQAADLFVLSSDREGLPMALLEAMATGLPALTTAVGGTPDLITHQRNGWLVPATEGTELQTGLITLLGDEGLRAELGRAARETVRQTYALPVVGRQTLELYRQLRDGPRRWTYL